MTLPVSGAISFNNINVELGVAGTTQASLGQSSYRTLAGVASGAISMSNFYGKSNRAAISYTFSANTANAALNLSTISGYAAGTSDITVTINSNVYLYATSTGNYGLNLTGGTTGDTLTIVNNGYIMGMGGTGGIRSASGSNVAGQSGGPALNFGFSLAGATVTNTSGYIGGGGGGGAYGDYYCGGGGGAGGGAGGGGTEPNGGVAAGGSGGGVGASGANGTTDWSRDPSYQTLIGLCASGGGGGRIMPGTGGGYSSGPYGGKYGLGGGSGGGGSTGNTPNPGSGGSAGNAGGNAANSDAAGGGGGWGALGGTGASARGSGGKAVNLNSKSITWTSGDTSRVYGAVS